MNKEIVLITGYNAAGKSTLVKEFVDKGYIRINRDTLGGSIDKMAENADVELQNTHILKNPSDCRIVLDNTYPSVESRKSIIAVAKKHKVPIRCIWLTTSLEDAQLNTCLRMIRITGHLLMPDDFKKIKDPGLFPPAAIYHYRKEFQEPSIKEGFGEVIETPFIRKWGPEYCNKAIIFDYDGTLRSHKGKQKYPCHPDEITILPNRKNKLKEFQDAGYILLGASNQSGIARGDITIEAAIACFEHTNKLLGVKIDYQFCPHRVPPITCYCRKPSPGIGAYFIEKYKLRPDFCMMVGDMGSDKSFAERCGFKYHPAEHFFK